MSIRISATSAWKNRLWDNASTKSGRYYKGRFKKLDLTYVSQVTIKWNPLLPKASSARWFRRAIAVDDFTKSTMEASNCKIIDDMHERLEPPTIEFLLKSKDNTRVLFDLRHLADWTFLKRNLALWCDSARRENESGIWNAENFALTKEHTRTNELIDTEDSILPHLNKRPNRREMRTIFWPEYDQPVQFSEFCENNRRFEKTYKNDTNIHRFTPFFNDTENNNTENNSNIESTHTKPSANLKVTANNTFEMEMNANTSDITENEIENDGNEDIISNKETETENIDMGDVSNLTDNEMSQLSNEIQEYINKYLIYYDDRLDELHSKLPHWNSNIKSLHYEGSHRIPYITYDYIVYDDNGIIYPNIHAMPKTAQDKAKKWGGDVFTKIFENDIEKKEKQRENDKLKQNSQENVNIDINKNDKEKIKEKQLKTA